MNKSLITLLILIPLLAGLSVLIGIATKVVKSPTSVWEANWQPIEMSYYPFPVSIASDSSGNIYVTGTEAGPRHSIFNNPIQNGYYLNQFTGNGEFVASRLLNIGNPVLLEDNGFIYIAGKTDDKLLVQKLRSFKDTEWTATLPLDNNFYVDDINSFGGFIYVHLLQIHHNSSIVVIDSEGNINSHLAYPDINILLFDINGNGDIYFTGSASNVAEESGCSGWAIGTITDDTISMLKYDDRFCGTHLLIDSDGNIIISNFDSIIKLNVNLDVLWEVRLGDLPYNAHALDVTLDDNSNIIACGSFGEAMNVITVNDTSAIVGPGRRDCFLIVIDSNGELVFETSWGTSSNDDYCMAVDIGQDSSIYAFSLFNNKSCLLKFIIPYGE